MLTGMRFVSGDGVRARNQELPLTGKTPCLDSGLILGYSGNEHKFTPVGMFAGGRFSLEQ
jgi:hypothetical protein